MRIVFSPQEKPVSPAFEGKMLIHLTLFSLDDTKSERPVWQNNLVNLRVLNNSAPCIAPFGAREAHCKWCAAPFGCYQLACPL